MLKKVLVLAGFALGVTVIGLFVYSKVVSNSGSPVEFTSSGAFLPVKVLSPNGGEIMFPGSQFSIKWDGGSAKTKVNIDLTDASGNLISSVAKGIVSQKGSSNSYAWSVPNLNGGLNYKIQISAKNNSDSSDNPFAIAIPLTLQAAPLPVAVTGAQYSAKISAFGGSGSYSWGLNSGALPPGLSLVQGVCVAMPGPCQAPVEISGIPTKVGTYSFTVVVGDGIQKDSKQFSIFVDQGIVVDPLPAAVTVAADPANPPAKQVVMGSALNSLAVFRLTETANMQDVKITDITVFDKVVSTASAKSSFANLGLYNGATLLGSASAGTIDASDYGYYYQFHFASPVIIPQAGSLSVALKGDVASYSSSGSTDGSIHTFKIQTLPSITALDTANEVVVAIGNSSNLSAPVTISSANGNALTVLRSKLSISATPLGLTANRAKSSVDDLADINFSANAAGGVQVGTVKITFSGSAPSASVGFFNTGTTGKVNLYDVSNGTTYNAISSDATNGTLTYDLGNWQMSAGMSKSFRLRINSASSTSPSQIGVSQTLIAAINNASDVTWKDALDSAAISATLENSVVPIKIQSVSYVSGT